MLMLVKRALQLTDVKPVCFYDTVFKNPATTKRYFGVERKMPPWPNPEPDKMVSPSVLISMPSCPPFLLLAAPCGSIQRCGAGFMFDVGFAENFLSRCMPASY